eukprot:290926-Karenia_brevis.AAC.1
MCSYVQEGYVGLRCALPPPEARSRRLMLPSGKRFRPRKRTVGGLRWPQMRVSSLRRMQREAYVR